VVDLLKRNAHVEEHDDARTMQANVTGQVLTLLDALQETIPTLLPLLEALPGDSPFQVAFPPSLPRSFLLLGRSTCADLPYTRYYLSMNLNPLLIKDCSRSWEGPHSLSGRTLFCSVEGPHLLPTVHALRPPFHDLPGPAFGDGESTDDEGCNESCPATTGRFATTVPHMVLSDVES
jgi:hypothetical protein